jgi:hypothetical protein
LILTIGQTEIEKRGPVRKSVANLIDILVCDRLHDGLHRILSNRGYRGHVGWFSLVALHPQLGAQLLQNIVLPLFKQFHQRFTASIAKKAYQILKSLIGLLDDEV